MSRLLVLAVLVVACKQSDPGPGCPQLVDHMLEVTKQLMPGHDPDQLGNRKEMIAQCEQRKYAPAIRKCLLAAKTLAELGECRLSDHRRPAAAGSAGGPPPGSAAGPLPGSAAGQPPGSAAGPP